jgi:hypothetical protein
MSSAEQSANKTPAVVLGTALLIAFALALIASLVNLWPAIERQTAAGTTARGTSAVRLLFTLVTVRATPSTALLLLVVLTGALGSLIHIATSFGDFVGNRRFYASWTAWYLLRPVVGVSLALLLYFSVRGGFLDSGAQSSNINPYGIAALAGLGGLFSKQATDKLREVFETLFKVSAKAGDAQRKDDLANPRPAVHAIEPAQLTVGAGGASLAIHGEHFLEGVSVVRIDDATHLPEFDSAQRLHLSLPDELTTHAGAVRVAVYNPPPGGGESQPPVILTIVEPAR